MATKVMVTIVTMLLFMFMSRDFYVEALCKRWWGDGDCEVIGRRKYPRPIYYQQQQPSQAQR
eukprot:UN11716